MIRERVYVVLALLVQNSTSASEGSCPDMSCTSDMMSLLQYNEKAFSMHRGSDTPENAMSKSQGPAQLSVVQEVTAEVLSGELLRAKAVPHLNAVSDASSMRTKIDVKPGVHLDTSHPHLVDSSDNTVQLHPWYGYETNENGVSCVPSSIPADCSEGVVHAFNPQGNVGGNITIPCGECWRWSQGAGVSQLREGLLIHGHLEIEDPGPGAELTIVTPYVLVTGHLRIAPTQGPSLLGKVTFHLQKGVPAGDDVTPYPVNLTYVREGCGESCAIPLGHSAFVVVGGGLFLQGFPGGSPSWSRLSSTAKKHSKIIEVDGDLSSWPKDGEIIVTSTEFGVAQEDQTERFKIIDVLYDSISNVTKVTLNQELSFDHWGETMNIPGFGPAPEVRAEVALLSRQIVIEGPYDYQLDNASLRTHGGHFGIFFTKTPQHVEGVEFRRMGQQGTFGRYPFHIHLSRDHSNSQVLKNSVVDSKQRCYVIHGTQNLVVAENVAYNVIGHCYMLEDGYEIHTQLLRNLVAVVKPPYDQPGLDPHEKGFNKGLEDDYTASGFWLAHAETEFVGNVAVGVCTCANCDRRLHKCDMCDDDVWIPPGTSSSIWQCSGVWFKMEEKVRRESKYLPDADKISRDENQAVGSPVKVRDNVMHGNHLGFRYYRPGWCPQLGIQEERNVFYKNYKGVFNHKNQNFVFRRYLFLDNREHLNLDQSDNMSLVDSAIVGISRLTSETGGSYCLTDRGKGSKPFMPAPRGLQWDAHFYFERSNGIPNVLRNVTFSGFDKTCTNEHTEVVTPRQIVLNKESTNAQDWVAEVLDSVAVDSNTVFLEFEPNPPNRGSKGHVPNIKQFNDLFPSGRYDDAWNLRHRHLHVANSPSLDPDTANGQTRWWLPSNHWQGRDLGVVYPEWKGAYKNKGKGKLKEKARPWPEGSQAPDSVVDQVHFCSTICAGSPFFALRRKDNHDPKSSQCFCLTQAFYDKLEVNKKGLELQGDWHCNSDEWWFKSGRLQKKGNWVNCIFEAKHSTTAPLCQGWLPTAHNMMSCPTSMCFRELRAAWHLADSQTFKVPSALELQNLNRSTPPLFQAAAMWSSSRIMLGDGTGNIGDRNAPETVGTGTMSLLAQQTYRMKIMIAQPHSNGNVWSASPFKVLKLELFDARHSLPAVYNSAHCALDLQIELQMAWTSSVPSGCTLNTNKDLLTCNDFKYGAIYLK